MNKLRQKELERFIPIMEFMMKDNLNETFTDTDIEYFCSLLSNSKDELFNEAHTSNNHFLRDTKVDLKNRKKLNTDQKKQIFLKKMYLSLDSSLTRKFADGITNDDINYLYSTYKMPLGEIDEYAKDIDKPYVIIDALITCVTKEFNVSRDLAAVRLRQVNELKKSEKSRSK